MSYTISWSPLVKRQIAEKLPLPIVEAAHAFIVGPLTENPYRVGKFLHPPMEKSLSARKGNYRIIYTIVGENIIIQSIVHRAWAYKGQ